MTDWELDGWWTELVLLHFSIALLFKNHVMFSVEAEWSATGDVGGSADEDILDAVFEWFWDWWRLLSMYIQNVEEFWASIIYCAGLSVLELAFHFEWQAETSTKEADWMWEYTQ